MEKKLEESRNKMKLELKISDYEKSEEFASKSIAAGVTTMAVVTTGAIAVFVALVAEGEKQRNLGDKRESITSQEALQVRAKMLKPKSELKKEISLSN